VQETAGGGMLTITRAGAALEMPLPAADGLTAPR
jgi:hypothetical protein